MDYSFNGDIAALYGVDEAVFIHNLYWWLRKNEADGRNFRDGRTWTYNSIRAFAQLFPFWTEKQVRRIIKKLSERGALLTGNYNEAKFDRTQWYSLSDEVCQIYAARRAQAPPKGRMQLPEKAQASAQAGAPIPDGNPDRKGSGGGALRQCIQFYEQNMGRLPRSIGDDISYWLEQGGEASLICACIEDAVKNNVYRWRWVEKALAASLAKGITTGEAYEGERRLRGQRGRVQNPFLQEDL